jgi:hypothetical protein
MSIGGGHLNRLPGERRFLFVLLVSNEADSEVILDDFGAASADDGDSEARVREKSVRLTESFDYADLDHDRSGLGCGEVSVLWDNLNPE